MYTQLKLKSNLLQFERTYLIKSIVVLFIIFLCSTSSYAQTLSGVVKSSDGKSIPFASIYIKELTTGTTTNLDGEYSIELPVGISHVSFQALAYAKVQLEIDMQDVDMVKDIVLKTQDYKIKEVRVFSGNEDPAYSILRKSISLAPYFLRQIKHYKASVYLKGGFDMNKVPRLFRKQLKEEGIEEGKSYVAESINEITFDSPNKFVHKQISKRSSIPNDGENEVLGYLNYSFYDSDSELAISPVSRKAFSFYNYRYEGFFQEGDYYVNKIKVMPKRKNQKLFEGYIYIVDKLWNIHSVDLVNEQFFGKIKIKQVQEPVKGKAWLPVSHHFDVDVKMMGFKMVANYGGSVKYEEVELDNNLPVPSSLKKAYAEVEAEKEFLEELNKATEPTKAQQKIESLLEKDDLNNREMLKLSRLMEKENKSLEQMGRGLELESLDSTYKIVQDTVSVDSVDWNKIRPIPLSKKEIESLGIKDSLTLALAGVKIDSTETEVPKNKTLSAVGNILGGKKYVLSDTTRLFTIRHYGLINSNSLGFNAVDGWLFVQNFNVRYGFLNKRKSRLDLFPSFKYAFNRKKFNWKVDSKLQYDHIKHTRFGLSAGMWSKDFKDENGISPFVNSVSSLFFKDNYMKLYQDNFVYAQFETDIVNGLVLNVGLKYQSIDRLTNSTNYSFAYLKDDYNANNKVGTHLNADIFKNRKGLQLESKLTYTPKYFYRIDKGKKRMIHSDYPTFTLLYKKGLDQIMNSSVKYDLLEFGVDKEMEWSFMYNLNYDVRAGYYFNNSAMHFSQYTHFNTNDVPVSFKNWKRNFNLLNDYEYSTNDWYVEAHFSYSAPYLLIKNIPFLQDKLWNENLYFSHLNQPKFRNYNEIGYGISQIFLVMNVGVFAGFEEMEFQRWGVKLSLNLDN